MTDRDTATGRFTGLSASPKARAQRRYRERHRLPVPRETTAKATSSGEISLVKAGLEPGTRYLASPRPNGAILLRPIPEHPR